MRIKILLLFMFIITLISAQNIFIWDRDDGSEITNPEDPWTYVGLESGIKEALTANGIFPVVDTLLADDLSGYDIIFATAGIWCGDWGWTPPDPVGSEDIQKLIDFLETGKAVYLESAIIGTGDHALLRPYFGLGNHSIANNLYTEIETIIADSTETFSGYSLNYLYGTNADYGLDELDAELGDPLTHSQDDAVRGVYYDSGIYRTIASSSFFGAMADGTNNNTKADVMLQYLNFLIGDLAPNIVASADQIDFGIIAPNYTHTFELEITNQGYETLSISDILISGEGFNYYGTTQFDLEHSQLQILEIEFEADELGQFSGELSILSNDPDTPELLIPLTAECLTDADDDLIVTTSKLIGNYPNPFNPSTTISFELAAENTENTRIEIYNLKGQKVKEFSNLQNQTSVTWNGVDNNNQPVSSGIYFYKLKSGNYTSTKKMILLK